MRSIDCIFVTKELVINLFVTCRESTLLTRNESCFFKIITFSLYEKRNIEEGQGCQFKPNQTNNNTIKQNRV